MHKRDVLSGKGEHTWERALEDALGHSKESERRTALRNLGISLEQKSEPIDVERVTDIVLNSIKGNRDAAVLIAEEVLTPLCNSYHLAHDPVRKRIGELPDRVRSIVNTLVIKGRSDSDSLQIDRGALRKSPSALLADGRLIVVVVAIFGAVGWLLWPSAGPPNPRQPRSTVRDLDMCQPPNPASVEQLVLGDTVVQGDPFLAPALLHVLGVERAARHSRAASLHLLGPAQRDIKERIVDLVALAHGAAGPGCTHHLAGRDYDSVEREVYEAGRRCPCAVVVCDDVAQVALPARSVWKRLLDDNPADLRPRGSTGLPVVDVRRLTFVLLSHQELTLPRPNLLDPLDPLSTAAILGLLKYGQQASRALHLWEDRVNHVIRHHLPILPTA